VNHLDGAAAEDYVRQRYDLPAGDFDRMKRQQQFLRALMAKVHKTNWLTSPTTFDRLMMAFTGALTVDESMPVQALVYSLRNLATTAVSYVTMPVGYSGELGGVGWVAQPDEAAAAQLWSALKDDTMEEYVAANPPNDVSHGA
jgi:anionic cell wall polymer biosynthesis LytR-Cps2A-Psr (LCP) family protein